MKFAAGATGPRPLLNRFLPDAEVSAGGDLREYREAVRRDLQELLNTRIRFLGGPPGLEQLSQSLVNYGIPDFTGASFADPASQREFRAILEQTIRAFEPRLRRASVTLHPLSGGVDRMLRFRIAGVLEFGTNSEKAEFESRLESSTSTFEVTG